jgi:hypothetical protein
MNYLIKIFLIILIIYAISCYCNKKELFVDSNNNLQNSLQIIFNSNYNYNYTKVNEVMLDELAFAILNKAKKEPVLLDKIERKIISIYGDMKTNSELKYYLKFMNFVNNDGFIFFENNSMDVYLTAKIKILLILIPSCDMKKLYDLIILSK